MRGMTSQHGRQHKVHPNQPEYYKWRYPSNESFEHESSFLSFSFVRPDAQGALSVCAEPNDRATQRPCIPHTLFITMKEIKVSTYMVCVERIFSFCSQIDRP